MSSPCGSATSRPASTSRSRSPLVGAAAVRGRRGHVPLPAGGRPALHPGHPLPGEQVGDGYARDTETRPTHRASRRRSCCPASRTRSTSRSRLRRPGRPAARCRPLQPARSQRRGQHDSASSPASGSIATSSCGCRTATRAFAVDRARTVSATPTSTEGTFQLTVIPPPPTARIARRRTSCCCSTGPAACRAGRSSPPAARPPASSTPSAATDRFAVLTFDNLIERPDDLARRAGRGHRSQPLPRGRAPGPHRCARRHRIARAARDRAAVCSAAATRAATGSSC